MSKTAELVESISLPFAEALGLSLWDVEYIREGGTYYLRIYIDKEGGVSINDCEALSRRVSDRLDELDPIEESYTLEVSSAGLERALRKLKHFAAFLGSKVAVHLYRAVNGKKIWVGELLSFERGDVTIKAEGAPITFSRNDVSLVRLSYFD